MTTTCTACRDNPVTDTFVCTPCADEYHGLLAEAPHIAAELAVEVAKLSRKGRQPSGHVKRTEQPLPYSPHASAALDRLRSELVGAVRIVALGDATAYPADTVPAMAEWLTRMEAAVMLRPEGGEIITGLADAIRRGRVIIDTPPERRFVGDCPCGDAEDRSRLLAVVGREYVRCPRCGTSYRVAECIAQLEDAMRDRWVTAAEVQTATVGRIKRDRVDKWVARGQIERDGEGRVRFGDACDLADEWDREVVRRRDRRDGVA